MVSGEVTYSTHIIAALSDSERAGGSGSMIENLTCPSGAAAGLNAVAPSVNARRNAAQKQLLSGKRNTILLTRQPLVQAYLLAQKRERCHNLLQLQVNEISQFKGFCRCTYSAAFLFLLRCSADFSRCRSLDLPFAMPSSNLDVQQSCRAGVTFQPDSPRK